MGPDGCGDVVLVDGVRDFGGDRNYSSRENDTDGAAGNIYKALWLVLVAYPLWRKGALWGSPAEGIASAFLWLPLPIVAVPWGYVFATYIYRPRKAQAASSPPGE
jgi:hypothetical protein